jgi:PAS domain S-box-containing protein
MPHANIRPSGVERSFGEDELIVSKTDEKGRIVYCNGLFVRLSGFDEAALLGAPHSIIRHPDMPRCVFKLLWDTIKAGSEIFAYVVNMSSNGDHYWVLAHVTPSMVDGRLAGFHSNRRKPAAAAVAAIKPLYAKLLAEEARGDSKEGLARAGAMLTGLLRDKGVTYDRFVLSL